MNEIERAIQIIERQKLQIGIDHTNGKDLTAICLVGNSAETALIALREKAERVLCAKCKHYNKAGCSEGFGWCESMDRGVSDDFYCANGAKMESEDST